MCLHVPCSSTGTCSILTVFFPYSCASSVQFIPCSRVGQMRASGSVPLPVPVRPAQPPAPRPWRCQITRRRTTPKSSGQRSSKPPHPPPHAPPNSSSPHLRNCPNTRWQWATTATTTKMSSSSCPRIKAVRLCVRVGETGRWLGRRRGLSRAGNGPRGPPTLVSLSCADLVPVLP